jgi:hypothetical protein
MKVCVKRPLSGQCLCPGLSNFGGKYFLFPAILGSTGYRWYSLKCWWMTFLSDLFGANEPTFFDFAPNFHTHPIPEQKVGCQVSGGHPSLRNLGFWISVGHPNFAEKVGYRVSGVPRVQCLGGKCFTSHA